MFPPNSGKARVTAILQLQIFLGAALLPIGWLYGQPSHKTPSQPQYPYSIATYADVSHAVGCESRYIEEKKSDIFDNQYKNHWMVWEGKVIHAEPQSVSLDMNGKGIHELQARFSNPNAGYDILVDSIIKVRFILRSQGGCFLPFTGDSASIVK